MHNQHGSGDSLTDDDGLSMKLIFIYYHILAERQPGECAGGLGNQHLEDLPPVGTPVGMPSGSWPAAVKPDVGSPGSCMGSSRASHSLARAACTVSPAAQIWEPGAL